MIMSKYFKFQEQRLLKNSLAEKFNFLRMKRWPVNILKVDFLIWISSLFEASPAQSGILSIIWDFWFQINNFSFP